MLLPHEGFPDFTATDFTGMDFILWTKLNSIPVRKTKCATGIELITRIVTPTDAVQCVYPANPKNKVGYKNIVGHHTPSEGNKIINTHRRKKQ